MWTEETIIQIAREMYEDGTSRCERYNERTCRSKEWPQHENDSIIYAIDS